MCNTKMSIIIGQCHRFDSPPTPKHSNSNASYYASHVPKNKGKKKDSQLNFISRSFK